MDAQGPPRHRARAAVVVALVAGAFLAPALLDGRAAPAREPAPQREVAATVEPAPRPERRAPSPAPSPTPPVTASGEAPIGGAAPRLTAPIVFDRDADLRVGRLVIPAIGLDTTFGNGVHDAVLETGPGHWPGTPMPGLAGNTVLSGHRTTWTQPFGDLDRLRPGDVVTAAQGTQPGTDYRVVETRIVPEAEYAAAVLAQPADPAARTITLFACHPKGSRTHRIIVTAAADPLAPSR
jgi:sortase A